MELIELCEVTETLFIFGPHVLVFPIFFDNSEVGDLSSNYLKDAALNTHSYRILCQSIIS